MVVSGSVDAEYSQTTFLTTLHSPDEVRLKNVRRLTTQRAAEAYFSFDDQKITFQSRRSPYDCDQQYIMNADDSEIKLLSNGLGQTTCGHFFPDGSNVRQLTSDIGDNGGAWFSHDNKKIVYRCFHPRGSSQIKAWQKSYTKKELGRFPHEICVMDADGSDKLELTNFGADLMPMFSYDGNRLLWISTQNNENLEKGIDNVFISYWRN